MKKHNPGCNCCGDVLIWNLDNEVPCNIGRRPGGGHPGHAPVNPRNPENTNWKWFTFDSITETLEGEGASVDEVTREDPDNWTEDINDYKLIMWPQPNRGDNCDWPLDACPPCHGTDEPIWWPDVKSGEWEGRIVIMWEASFAIETAVEYGFDERPPFGGPITYTTDCSPITDPIDLCAPTYFDRHELQFGWPGSLRSICFLESTAPVLVPDRRDHRLLENCDGVWIYGSGGLFAPGEIVLEHQVIGDSANDVCTPNYPQPSSHFIVREAIMNNQSRIVSADSAIFTDRIEQVVSGADTENRQFWRNLFNLPVRD